MDNNNIVASTRDGIEKFLDTINKMFGNKKVLINDGLVSSDWYSPEYKEYAPGIFVIEKVSSTRVTDDIIDTTGTIRKYRAGDIIYVDKDSPNTICVQLGPVKKKLDYFLYWYANNGSKVHCIGCWDSINNMVLVKEGCEYLLTYDDDGFEPTTKFQLITEEN